MKMLLCLLCSVGALGAASSASHGGDKNSNREPLAPTSLPLPNVWSAGQVLRFSGLDGPTDWDTRFWAFTGADHYEFLLRTQPEIRISLRIPGDGVELRYFLGDALLAESEDSWLAMAFWQQRCLVGHCRGRAQVQVTYAAPDGHQPFPVDEPLRLKSGTGAKEGASYQEYVVLKTSGDPTDLRWALAYDRESPERASHRAEMGLIQDVKSLCQEKVERVCSIDFDFTGCSQDEIQTALKACSILRGAYKAPEGQFVSHWSAPSPHHVHLNVWDTLFHCYGTRFLDPVLAEQDALALLQAQRDDGFIGNPQRPPEPNHSARGIHPPLIGWALWNSYQKRGDRRTLEVAYPRLARFIDWVRSNKDANHNLLLEWRPGDGCESGRDNDPRFDQRKVFDAVDLTGFIGSEMLHLALMADELGYEAEAKRWRDEHAKVRQALNETLWDEEDDFYYCRTLEGDWIRIKTNASFVALFGGLATPERAERMVRKHLLNPKEFWTPMPVPTVSMDDRFYELDMWRGPVWHCYNHLVLDGLLRYGYREEAEELIRRTIDATVYWYSRTGSIWEFYDPENKVDPRELNRKGSKRGSIPEYSWSAAELLHFLDLSRPGSGLPIPGQAQHGQQAP